MSIDEIEELLAKYKLGVAQLSEKSLKSFVKNLFNQPKGITLDEIIKLLVEISKLDNKAETVTEAIQWLPNIYNAIKHSDVAFSKLQPSDDYATISPIESFLRKIHSQSHPDSVLKMRVLRDGIKESKFNDYWVRDCRCAYDNVEKIYTHHGLPYFLKACLETDSDQVALENAIALAKKINAYPQTKPTLINFTRTLYSFCNPNGQAAEMILDIAYEDMENELIPITKAAFWLGENSNNTDRREKIFKRYLTESPQFNDYFNETDFCRYIYSTTQEKSRDFAIIILNEGFNLLKNKNKRYKNREKQPLENIFLTQESENYFMNYDTEVWYTEVWVLFESSKFPELYETIAVVLPETLENFSGQTKTKLLKTLLSNSELKDFLESKESEILINNAHHALELATNTQIPAEHMALILLLLESSKETTGHQ